MPLLTPDLNDFSFEQTYFISLCYTVCRLCSQLTLLAATSCFPALLHVKHFVTVFKGAV